MLPDLKVFVCRAILKQRYNQLSKRDEKQYGGGSLDFCKSKCNFIGVGVGAIILYSNSRGSTPSNWTNTDHEIHEICYDTQAPTMS